MSKHTWKIRFSFILLAVLSYVVCALAAYFRFPRSFSPDRNWLSDLGNPDQNPGGAVFYNLGILLAGLMLLLFFFLTAPDWKLQNRKIQNWMVRITQLFGILGSLALIMSAVFPINFPHHEFFSISLYILLGTAFGFSVAALRYLPTCPKWVLALGGVTALVDILSGIFHESTSLEWVTVALFITYLLTLSYTPIRAARFR